MLYDTLLLQYLQMGINNAISRGELLQYQGFYASERLAPMNADMLVRNFVMTWAGMQSTHSVQYPANWWEAVKERWFPVWAQARWPVRRITWTVDAWRLFRNLPAHVQDAARQWRPELRIVIPKRRPMGDMWSNE
jgi:hypothetical protein